MTNYCKPMRSRYQRFAYGSAAKSEWHTAGRNRAFGHTREMRLLSFVLLCGLFAAACGGDDGSDAIPTAPSINVAYSTTDLRIGTGTEATAGRRVTVNYTGWIYSTTAPDNKGQQFGTSVGGQPFPLTAGGNDAIQGFSQAVVGMRVGGLRRVVVPPNLGYGSNPPSGSGIRANETLLFEIELLAVQ
jgi:FKBP-type peptidyl-prolyl cis-trans isomerase FkpA